MWLRRILTRDKASEIARRTPQKIEKSISFSLAPEVFRQLDRLLIRGSRDLYGDRFGHRTSDRRKPSMEFLENRVYLPGDDIRYVDWRASARHDQVYIRQGDQPKAVTVYLLMDCSASMLWGEHPKENMQKRLAAVFAYLSLAQGDRLYVRPYGGPGNSDFGPVTGKGQFKSFVKYLSKLNYGGEASLTNGLEGLNRKISKGGVMFVLSDMLEPGDLNQILSVIPAPLWWVNVIHLLHPCEVTPSFKGPLQLVDLENGLIANFDLNADALTEYKIRISEWQDRLEMDCVQNHAFYVQIDTQASFEREVIPLLRSAEILVAA